MPIHLENEGDPTKEKCPKCGAPIIYNGNYFCLYWSNEHPLPVGACNWALPHPQTELVDKQLSMNLVGYWEEEDEDGIVREYP
ncbi:hypothetical protein ACFY7C_36720 [Streptomyces sp. NPDC012769]|uniref:hypothetical protein n=1 Tax=Streptomyces sp. NPDC012769 TaxID=3364848 RepID=UPI00368C9793